MEVKKQFDTKINLNLFAFTLAEVLITLGIIGVVAMMTIPSLIQKVDESSWHQAWRKEFSIISQAYMQFKANNGGSLDEYFTRATGNYFPDPFVDKFTTYFKTSITCLMTTTNINSTCGTNFSLVNFYKTIDNQYIMYPNFDYGNFILVDGTQIYLRTYQGGHFLVFADVNGASKGPNILGKDLYGAVMSTDKVIPLGATGTGLENTCNSSPATCNASNNIGCHDPSNFSGAGCSAYYLSNP